MIVITSVRKLKVFITTIEGLEEGSPGFVMNWKTKCGLRKVKY